MSYDGSITMDFLLKQMQPDEKWIERREDGFKWAYSKFGQDVSMEECRNPDFPEETTWFFTVTAPMLKGVKNTVENRKILNDYVFFNTSMCIPVYDHKTETLSLVIRVGIHEQIAQWMTKMLSILMVIQMHEVLKNAEQIAMLTKSEPDYYNHPVNGIRTDIDEIVKVYDDLVLPAGKLPSFCSPTEIKETAEQYMQGFPCVLTNFSDFGITTEFPQGLDTSLLEFETLETHVDYGFGLNIKHSFFKEDDEDKGVCLAIYMNQQIAIGVRSYGLGSFVYRNGFFVYRMFVPNFAYTNGLLKNLFIASASKARSMNRFLNLPEWNVDVVEKCQIQKMKMLAAFAGMSDEELSQKIQLEKRRSNFSENREPDSKGFPETDDVLGTDRITVNRKRFYCPNPAHTRWEEYYEVTIDGNDYHLFNRAPHDLIAEIYPGREYGRTVVRITDDVRKALVSMDTKSHPGRDCVNPGALKMFHKDLYEEYLKYHPEKKGK